MICQTIAAHDRSRVDVFAYSYGQDDGSRCRALVERCSERFIDVCTLPFPDAARRIHADQIDILVDLAGHTTRNRLEICALSASAGAGDLSWLSR
jgi:protein O-GlcNAc transferase